MSNISDLAQALSVLNLAQQEHDAQPEHIAELEEKAMNALRLSINEADGGSPSIH